MLKYKSPLLELPDNWLQCAGFGAIPCYKAYHKTEIRNECDCGELLEVMIDYEPHMDISAKKWRNTLKSRAQKSYLFDAKHIGMYQEFLPINDLDTIVYGGEGMTPIVGAPKTAKKIGLQSLLAKLLGQNLTGSFKDYGVPMALTQANWLYKNEYLKTKKVGVSSTGNTSSSVAAFAVRADFDPYVFFGEASKSKLFQTAMHGAHLIKLDDSSFDDAMRMADELSKQGEFYLCNSINPYRIEGQKTIAFETALQMNFNPPDVIVVPVGNAGNISAIYKGLTEWENLGIIKKIPRLYGVQAEGADPIAIKFKTGKYEKILKPRTDASAIKIGDPRSGEKAERAVRSTGGTVISVPDKEIFAWQKYLASNDGIGCEPASAASVAGLNHFVADGLIDPDETVICMLTGHILKDSENPLKSEYNPNLLSWPEVPANEDAILKILHGY